MTMIDANTPKHRIFIIGLKAVTTNAAHVVNDVVVIAETALVNDHAKRFDNANFSSLPFRTSSLIV